MSQASSTRKTAVTAVALRPRRTSGGDGARLAVKAGQMAIATAPTEVQTRCCGFVPWTGCGETAMPMLDRPAISSTVRDSARWPGRQAALTK
jgi:hypothetical protein